MDVSEFKIDVSGLKRAFHSTKLDKLALQAAGLREGLPKTLQGRCLLV